MSTFFKNKEVVSSDDDEGANSKDDETDNVNDGDSYNADGLVDGEEEVYDFDGDADSLAIDINDVENVLEYQFSSASQSMSQSASQSTYDMSKLSSFMQGSMTNTALSSAKKSMPKLAPEYTGQDDPNSPLAGKTSHQQSRVLQPPLPVDFSNSESKKTVATDILTESVTATESEVTNPMEVQQISDSLAATLPTVGETSSESASLEALLASGGFCSPAREVDNELRLEPVAPAPTEPTNSTDLPIIEDNKAEFEVAGLEEEEALPPPPLAATSNGLIHEKGNRRQSVGDRRRYDWISCLNCTF